MKNLKLKNFRLLLFLFVLVVNSCSTNNQNENDNKTKTSFSNEAKEENIEYKINSWIDFPYVSVDAKNMNGRIFNLKISDSTGLFNRTLVNQYVTIHLLQCNLSLSSFDSIKVEVNIIDQKNRVETVFISNQEYLEMQINYSNKLFKDFVREFLILNFETAYIDSSGWQKSLIDRTNMFFAHQIDSFYNQYFSENSTWFGQNSFAIFGIFLQECFSENIGIGHALINSIPTSSQYLDPKQISSLIKLVKKYEAIIERNLKEDTAKENQRRM